MIIDFSCIDQEHKHVLGEAYPPFCEKPYPCLCPAHVCCASIIVASSIRISSLDHNPEYELLIMYPFVCTCVWGGGVHPPCGMCVSVL